MSDGAPIITRGLVRAGLFAGMGSFAIMMVGGCLIPFTAGVSSVLMLPALLGWPFAVLVGWRGIKALPVGDPVRPWAQASLVVGGAGLVLVGFTLGILLLSILAGVAIAELTPGGFHPHFGH